MDEFIKLLESTDDKLSLLRDLKIVSDYNVLLKDYFNLVGKYLNDVEMLELFNDETISKTLGRYRVLKFINEASDRLKIHAISSEEFRTRYDMKSFDEVSLLSSLSEQALLDILSKKDFISEELNLKNYQMLGMIENLSDETIKLNLASEYGLSQFQIMDLVKSFSQEGKEKFLLNGEKLNRADINSLICTMDTDSMVSFISKHGDFLAENKLSVCKITMHLEKEKQKEFIERIEETGLDLNEKKKIFVSLNQETKQEIDTSKLPKEYAEAMALQFNPETGKLCVDYSLDMERYKGFDDLISIMPTEYSDEERKKLKELCGICPDLTVKNKVNDSDVYFASSGSEYIVAEEWIDSVLSSIPKDATDIQKLAIIDNAIGKRHSYAPDFGTEVFDQENNRALWKIIASGYGVCNGLARVENYMLNRVGVNSEIISSGKHAFLRIKNIEIPREDGTTVTGDTLNDPTWNLTNHRFGSRPNCFCLSYEEMRKNDIDDKGIDHKSHETEKIHDVTLGIDSKSLREVFTSVGLANGETKGFPIGEFIKKSDELDKEFSNSPLQNIYAQLGLLSEEFPDFATCQDSSMSILKNVLLKKPNIGFSKCVVNRVYERNDTERKPIMYTYVASPKIGKRFFVANAEQAKFIEMDPIQFIKQYECYDRDLEKSDGVRPWESGIQKEKETNLNISSGEIVAEKGDER